MTVRLRILSGIHKGAELDLTPGDWSLGSDALCDILLSDTAPQQATLRVSEEGGVTMLPQEATSLLDGQPVPPQGLPLPYFVCVQWGPVYAAVGPAEADWPPVPLPDAKAMPAPQNFEGDNGKGGKGEKEEAGAVARESPLHMATAQDMAAARGGDPLQTGGQDQAFASRSGIWGHMGRSVGTCFSPARLVLLLLLLSLSAGGLWQCRGKDKTQQSLENIEAVLRAEGLRPAAFDVEENMGAWTVRGVVSDTTTVQNLSAALRGLGVPMQADILSLQSVAEALEARIQTEGARLNVTQRGQSLRLAGYVFDAQSLQRLLQPLQADCQRAQLQQDVIFWQELRQPLKDSLAALKLQEGVRMTPGPYTIAVDATALGAKQGEALRTLEREVTDMTRGISPLTHGAAPTAPGTSPKTPQTARRAVLCEQLRVSHATGGQGGALVIIVEGREYAPGAHLPGGMQVQEVRPEYVTLVQGDRLVYCPAR